MRTTYSLTSLIGVMAISMVFMFQEHTLLNLATLGLLISLIVVMTIISTRFIFPTALSGILLFGFLLTGWSLFFQTAPPQTDLIVQHILFTLFVVCSWLFFSQTRSLVQRNSDLENKVNYLKKYEPVTKLLTNSEFESRVELMLTGMRRRNESGYLIHIVPKQQTYTHAALKKSLGQIILDSIRNHFDFLTQNQDGSFSIFLQNTNEVGLNTVLERISTNRIEVITSKEPPYSTYTHEMKEYNLKISSDYLYMQRKEA
ncbi:hypothetical protein [Alkalicoccobacillus murimartini]|uniref:GGDEF domain-containing protein n=1 Tax=Alkalicoccobacillus murimartini TaxID=171685 RepID=A0ABT9YEU2_9BACI|nr:hypothetical protein [Alkalicoccobacillus murimartini]MDQ0206056.1 GGDEF domain-containing protein [Alkalicoccobacillus murimartini]